jgi:hypothetical protein
MLNLSFLRFLAKEISDFTGNNIPVENFVWSNIINQDGSVAIPLPSVAITLVKIEKETVTNKSNTIYKDGQYGVTMPALTVNLYIQFAVYNQDYAETLKQIGHVLSYFQSHPVLTTQNTPALAGSGVDKLTFEMVNYTHQDLSNLWSQLGAKYLPSVVYKMRMIIIDEYTPVLNAPITSVEAAVAGGNFTANGN